MSAESLGGCLCGAIRYRFTGEPLAFYACHCSDCQRQTGSAFALSMVVPQESVEVISGKPERFEIELPDGRTKRGAFCSACAVRMWGEPVKFPQLYVLRPGTFDNVTTHRPWGDIWTSSAQPWVGLTAGPRYSHQPEDPMALVTAWKTRPAGV